MNNFDIIEKLNAGNFGVVFKIRKAIGKDQGRIYAMKQLSIADCVGNNFYFNTIKIERDVLEVVKDRPFLIQMHYAIVTTSHVNFILDYAKGGDLEARLRLVKRFSLDEVRICAAEICLALKFLHQRKICYRDIKVENILIDAGGHMVLADFGLAVRLEDGKKLRQYCGTSEYMAPEILLKTGYRFEVDWWATGVLIFEILTGYIPFGCNEDDATVLRESILNEPPKLIYVEYVTSDPFVYDIINRLLNKTVNQRLGSGDNGYQNVEDHPFFADLNWNRLRNKGYPCLNMPKVPELPRSEEENCGNVGHADENVKIKSSFLKSFQEFSYGTDRLALEANVKEEPVELEQNGGSDQNEEEDEEEEEEEHEEKEEEAVVVVEDEDEKSDDDSNHVDDDDDDDDGVVVVSTAAGENTNKHNPFKNANDIAKENWLPPQIIDVLDDDDGQGDELFHGFDNSMEAPVLPGTAASCTVLLKRLYRGNQRPFTERNNNNNVDNSDGNALVAAPSQQPQSSSSSRNLTEANPVNCNKPKNANNNKNIDSVHAPAAVQVRRSSTRKRRPPSRLKMQ